MATFRDLLSYVKNGEPVNESTINRVLAQLQENCQSLKSDISVIANSSGIYAKGVTFDSSVLLSHAVYYKDTTDKFENAQAIAGKESCLGICSAKTSSTTGDILLSGSAAIDMTNAIGGSVPAGRYFLSDSQPGKLTTVRPTNIQISVLIADGETGGKVYVLPHENRSIAGPTGPTGATGAAGAVGATGPAGPASYLYKHKDATTWHVAGQLTGNSFTGFTPVVDTLYAVPLYTLAGGTIDQAVFNVVNAGGPGSDARIGFYGATNVGSGNLYPSTRLIADLGGLNASSAGVKSVSVSGLTLTANSLIWVAFCFGVGSPVANFTGLDWKSMHPLLGVNSAFDQPGIGYKVGFSYGALPSSFPGSAQIVRAAEMPAIGLRFTS